MIIRNWLRSSKLVYADLALIAASVIGSFALRLDLKSLVEDYLLTILLFLVIAWVVKPLVFRRMGLYQRVWAYASIDEMKLIVGAVTMASLAVTLLVVPLYLLRVMYPMPRSVLVIDWLASLAAIGAARFGIRLLAESRSNGAADAVPAARQVLIVGAGDAGALVARELQKNPQLGLFPRGFLDDDEDKQGNQIHGVPVVGALSNLPEQAKERHIDEIIFAIPSAPGSVLRQVAELCRQQGLPFRTMPGLYELIGGAVSVSRLRPVDITDLLRREPARIDRERVAANLRGRRVLVTGAGGSIASELCRQVARWAPKELVLLGHGENSIFEILLEMNRDYPGLDVHPVICDIRDARRLSTVVGQHKPDLIFHAAAHKHVPLMEMNVVEAVTNNILGTQNVVAAALEHGIQHLVMISTDKAVRPSSVMGATKRMAEWLVLDAAQRSKHDFSVVRFGNVLGSRGSVVPRFEQQIAAGGPLTITHPEMERYFMTIPEAVHLVLEASTLDKRGQMYMLNMGAPVRIVDLAEDLIRLSGLEPGEDIEIIFSGLRPGEKLSEELWEPGGEYHPTAHPDITQVEEGGRLSGAELVNALKRLAALAQAGDSAGLVQALQDLLPGAEIGRAQNLDFTSVV